MNKFRRFLDRISAETCLKMDYFGSSLVVNAKNRQALEAPLPELRMNLQDPTSIGHSG